MKTHIWLGLGVLALLCTGLTSKAEAAKKGGADAAAVESGISTSREAGTGKASGKMAAGKASPRTAPTKGGDSGGTASKIKYTKTDPPVKSQNGILCEYTGKDAEGNTVTIWRVCDGGKTIFE